MPSPARFPAYFYWGFVPVVAVLLAFWPAVHADFVWDDRALLLSMPVLRNVSDWIASLSLGFVTDAGYFRPLPALVLALEQTLASDGRFVAHLHAVIWHAANTGLVALLAFQLGRHHGFDPRAAAIRSMICGSIFGLHPATVETVAWASCRFELMYSLFGLLALVADISLRGRWARAAAVGIAFFLAALSKESALGLALLLPFWHRFTSRVAIAQRKDLAVYAAVLVSGLFYLALRHRFLGSTYAVASPAFAIGSVEHLAVALKSLGFYVSLIVWPFGNVAPLHPLDLPVALVDPLAIGGAVAASLAIVTAFRRSSSTDLLLCAVAALVPALNIFPLPIQLNIGHDRFVYFPLALVALWCGLRLPRPSAVRFRGGLALGISAGVAWLMASTLHTRANLDHWNNDLNLWTWIYTRHPNTELAQTNLLATYVNAGQYSKAIEFAEMLLDRSGGQLTPQQLASMLEAISALRDPPPELLEILTSVLNQEAESQPAAVNATTVQVFVSAARMNLRMGRLKEADKLYRLILSWNPQQPDANYGLSVMAAMHGDATAEAHYKTLWQQHVHPIKLQAWRERMQGDMEQARRHLIDAPTTAPIQ